MHSVALCKGIISPGFECLRTFFNNFVYEHFISRSVWLRSRFWASTVATSNATAMTCTHSWYATLRKWYRPLTWPLTSYLRSYTHTLCWTTRYKWGGIVSVWRECAVTLVTACCHVCRFVHTMLTKLRTCVCWTLRTLISWSQSVEWSSGHHLLYQRWGRVSKCVDFKIIWLYIYYNFHPVLYKYHQ